MLIFSCFFFFLFFHLFNIVFNILDIPSEFCLPFVSFFSPSLKCFYFCISCTLWLIFTALCSPVFLILLSLCLPFIFLFSLSLSIHSFLSPHFSLFCSLTISPRDYLSVIWRMGLQHRGQGTRCSGCHCYSNLYHDTGSRATHHAEVKLPRDTWQEELKHRTLQGNT